jgi:hypothetical protein
MKEDDLAWMYWGSPPVVHRIPVRIVKVALNVAIVEAEPIEIKGDNFVPFPFDKEGRSIGVISLARLTPRDAREKPLARPL